MKKPKPTPKTVAPQTPTLTDRQKLDLTNAIHAAEAANQAAQPQAVAGAIVQLMQERAQAAQRSIDAANALIASLNTVPGFQLDPLRGEFTPKG